MREADITPELLREILRYEPETGKLFWRIRKGRAVAGVEAGHLDIHGYVTIRIQRRLCRAHRIAWAITYGEWPASILDHINRNRADNRLCNLRLATRSQNCVNKPAPKNSTTAQTGVHYFKRTKQWTAFYTKDGKRTWLGYFDTFEAAISARKTAIVAAFGDFAYEAHEYNAAQDFAGSLNDGYAVIRERMANGGPGWTPKG